MKKTYVTLFGILFLSLSLNASEFNVCPDISGSYTCTGLKEKLNLEITQNKQEFIMNLGNGPVAFIADETEKETNTTQEDTQVLVTVYGKCYDKGVEAAKRIKTINAQSTKEVDTFFVFNKIDSKNLIFYATTEFLVNNVVSQPIENKLFCTKN